MNKIYFLKKGNFMDENKEEQIIKNHRSSSLDRLNYIPQSNSAALSKITDYGKSLK